MKKLLLTILIYIASENLFAQAPTWEWARNAAGNTQDEAFSVATDNSGNVYVTGYFYSSSISFDTIALTNSSSSGAEIFLVKYDAAGNALWARSAGGLDDDFSVSCAVDGDGNILISGYTTSTLITFGLFTLFGAGAEDMFIAKFDNAGNVVWARTIGDSAREISFSVSADASGNSYVCGYFQSPLIAFDTIVLSNSGGADMFAAKFDYYGNVLWANSAGSNDNDIAYSVSVDGWGNVYTAGYFLSTSITFGLTTLNNAGGYDIFIVKYDSTGQPVWANRAGDTGNDIANSVFADASGYVYLAGNFGSTSIIFGSTILSGAGGKDAFIARYDNSGAVMWAASAGGAYHEEAHSVYADGAGNVYVTGNFQSPSITFGSYTLTNAGSFVEDLFVVNFDASSTVLWATGTGGSAEDYGNGVCADAGGNVYVTGYYNSPTIPFGASAITNSITPYYDSYLAKLSSTVGIKENSGDENSIVIFPNPVSQNSSISIMLSKKYNSVESELKIFNVLGEKIYAEKFNSSHATVNCKLSSGIYFTEVKNDNGVWRKKIVVE